MTRNGNKTLYLIDGHSQSYQAYYAIRELAAPDGTPTNAVFGFTSMLLALVRERRPDLLAVAFDLPGPTFRHEAMEEYKAHRSPMPEDLISQIPIIKEVLEGFGVPIFEADGFEADDVLATLTRRGEEEGFDVVIVSRDKDLFQLLGEQTRMLDARTGDFWDPKNLKEKKGIRPDQVADYLALVGDAADNVKGVPGVGEKTA